MGHPLESLHLRNLKSLAKTVQQLVSGRLWAKVLIGMALGIGVGLLLGPSVGWLSPRTAEVTGAWLALPGHLFLALIQMIVVPLIVASVIRGIASSSDIAQLRSTGIGLAIYFLVTTVMATGIGLAFAYLVRPGRLIDEELAANMAGGGDADSTAQAIQTLDTESLDAARVPHGLISVFPENPVRAMSQGDMLQVVVFGIVFGVALISIKPQSSRPIFELMGSTQDVCMTIVGFVMRLAPLAVFGLLADVMIKTGSGVLLGLGVYAASVVGALIVLLFFYLLIVGTIGGYSPWRFLRGIREAQLLAFSTDSSAATMPISIRNAEDNLDVRPSIAQLVIPIGATMNMGGTACYHGLATVFMAQAFGMGLPVTAILALIVTSLGSSIGAPATPGVGIMILATVLTSAGVPLGGLALIIGFDQLLERFRCVMNVSGDLVACVVMDKTTASKKSRAQELDEARALEERREVTEEDLVLLREPSTD